MSLLTEFGPSALRNYPTFPGWQGDPPRTAEHSLYHQYRWVGWWAFVQAIFNRPELPADQYPRPESMRASRAFEGGLRIIPIGYLDDVVIPGDLTDTELNRHNLRLPITVQLPVSGAPIVPRVDVPTLLRARSNGFGEIAVKVFYV
jgi:hypothetical protein